MFGVGYDKYWEQFPGLYEELMQKQEKFIGKIPTHGTVVVDFGDIRTTSVWNSEYISLTVFYDSGRVIRRESWQPIITFGWDVPVKFLVAENVSKTHTISFGMDIRF